MSRLSQSCAEATRWISESQEANLPRTVRIGLLMHLAICRQCRRYRRQINQMRSVFVHYTEHLPLPPLPAEFRQEVVRELRKLS